MKRFLLSCAVAALFLSVAGCSQQRRWNDQQRRAVREALNSYRRMVYLTDLTDAEFVDFSDGVAVDLEHSYPVYTEFITMPGVDDTVERVVVATIVEELNTNAHNMRHLYPYNYLVAQGMLPPGLTHDQLKSFYTCFSHKVNKNFTSMNQFFNAILNDTSNTSQIARMEAQCADDLFDWTVTVTEMLEE